MKKDKQSRDELLARSVHEDQTPDELLDGEQLKRKRNREKKRKQRDGESKEKAASIAASEQEWWSGNRASLKAEELAELKEQDAYIRDLLFSMRTVVNVHELDPELIDSIATHVKEHGVPHLGYFSKTGLQPDWSEQQYWRSAEVMGMLIEEGKPTEVYGRYGLLIGLPDYRVSEFLQKAGWTWQQAANLVGYTCGRLNEVSYR
jgi:hypothetical protein